MVDVEQQVRDRLVRESRTYLVLIDHKVDHRRRALDGLVRTAYGDPGRPHRTDPWPRSSFRQGQNSDDETDGPPAAGADVPNGGIPRTMSKVDGSILVRR